MSLIGVGFQLAFFSYVYNSRNVRVFMSTCSASLNGSSIFVSDNPWNDLLKHQYHTAIKTLGTSALDVTIIRNNEC